MSTTAVPGGSEPISDSARTSFSLSGKNLQNIALVPVIAVVCVLGAIVSPHFMTSTNIIDNVLALSAPLAILVIAESIILIGGFFDLSLQSTVSFSVIVLAVLIAAPATGTRGYDLPLPLALFITFAVVLLIGLLNGFLVSVLKLNAFIVTLAMLILIQGVTLGISNGQTYTELPDFVLWLGSGSVLGLPIQAAIFIGAFAIAVAVMRLTPTGRGIYAMGGSIEAARAAGLNIRRLTVGLFVAGSLLALLAGLMLAAQTSVATGTLGDNIIFTVFAAAVLGGIDLNGGRGTLIGAALGVLLLSIIQNILTLSNVPSFWINAAYGVIILGALLIGRVSSMISNLRQLSNRRRSEHYSGSS
ncbi:MULTISPECIES: ABC transporter permease [unclassified Rhodococcus (in: high G+C Gram-positive bacteria)]|uniref:ABC transporter permease n=1 Tax=unclassified Rhodococcus (in: high G+C Gram-positive bacteria) TaxID=192944 RepID=UPI00138F9C2C|nr:MULTISPECIES: ABC transporter permease [unclassified Rhodococcus (in: high G+C Gram-positive bacteria)]